MWSLKVPRLVGWRLCIANEEARIGRPVHVTYPRSVTFHVHLSSCDCGHNHSLWTNDASEG